MGEHGMTPWRAGCAETCTPGSEGGPRKRTGRNTATAPWPDPYTYLRTWEGWLYLVAVQDLYSRRIVGWAMADHMRAELVTDALQMALSHRRPARGLIWHSDQGSLVSSSASRSASRPAPPGSRNRWEAEATASTTPSPRASSRP